MKISDNINVLIVRLPVDWLSFNSEGHIGEWWQDGSLRIDHQQPHTSHKRKIANAHVD